MSADFEDWTNGVEIVTGGALGVDFPDWTEAVEVAGGSTGGYASLTGAGETATPGNLTQQGGFDIFDTIGGGHVVSTNGSLNLGANSSSPVLLENIGSGGVTIEQTGAGPINILAQTNATHIEMKATNGAGNAYVNVEAVGTSGAVGIAGGANAGFLTPTAATVQIAGRNEIDLFFGANSGLPKGGRGLRIADVATGGTGFYIFTNNGNPNGVFAGTGNGDLCVDTSTPNLWQWHSGTTTWVAL